MTTKPRARRFRLRLSEDATGAPVAAPARPARPQAGAEPARDADRQAAARAALRQEPRPEALFDEERGGARAQDGTRDDDSAGRAAAQSGSAGGAGDSGSDGARGEDGGAGVGRGLTAAARRAAAAMAMAKLRQSASSGHAAEKAEKTAASPGAEGGATGASDAGAPDAPGAETDDIEAEIEAIRAEQLTGRQLRMAMRVAQKHGIKAASGLEAVRLLRRRGIDPFEQSTLLDIVKNRPEPGRALTTVDPPPLPRTVRQPGMAPAPYQVGGDRGTEIARIQQNIVRRRRRRLALLAARLAVFVFLPTFLAGWYFFVIATPLYATNTEFVIQQADSQPSSAGQAGALGGLFSGTGLATSQDSVTVQSYLQSREAMRRLDADHDFKAHFQGEDMDPLRRLDADATDEAAYRLYRRMVQISYDPTEGIIKMEVIAADPETSERFSRALIEYAEEQVDQLTQRLRENQMRDAMASFERTEQSMAEAQEQVLDLQERFQVLSSEVEVTLLTQQITTLEGQLNQERLTLEDLLSNTRPNAARVEQAQRRINALETQINTLRDSLTQSGGEGDASLARVQREMVMAEADVATRQMMMANSLQQLEAARIEANRQVRYLSMGVSPVAPDESTYPRKLENTALAFLIFAGVYLMISMTVSILREQVTS
ncbi:MAG: capsular polysaccharide transport system permease protein [Rhodobacteraceae bacterium HLUCCA12]|nr:MAG: capsular polysaccharide transport system permease protein [Rhodobacteraceae bacterium HLUCCA12]